MKNATVLAEKLRAFAAAILSSPHDRVAVAGGFSAIAGALEEVQALMESYTDDGCAECGEPAPLDVPPLPVIDAQDLPDLGREINAEISQAA